MTTPVRQRAQQRAKGEKWFKGLSTADKFLLGDAFVLGDFDWRDWLPSQPTGAFLAGAEYARLLWESSACD